MSHADLIERQRPLKSLAMEFLLKAALSMNDAVEGGDPEKAKDALASIGIAERFVRQFLEAHGTWRSSE